MAGAAVVRGWAGVGGFAADWRTSADAARGATAGIDDAGFAGCGEVVGCDEVVGAAGGDLMGCGVVNVGVLGVGAAAGTVT